MPDERHQPVVKVPGVAWRGVEDPSVPGNDLVDGGKGAVKTTRKRRHTWHKSQQETAY
jgi:hypothetical protein